MSELRRQSALIIWALWSFYTALSAAFTDLQLCREHYINFALVGVGIVAQLLTRPGRYLIVFLLFIVCFFISTSFMPAVAVLHIGSLTLSFPYFLFILYFLIMNRSDLSDWASYFRDEKKTA